MVTEYWKLFFKLLTECSCCLPLHFCNLLLKQSARHNNALFVVRSNNPPIILPVCIRENRWRKIWPDSMKLFILFIRWTLFDFLIFYNFSLEVELLLFFCFESLGQRFWVFFIIFGGKNGCDGQLFKNLWLPSKIQFLFYFLNVFTLPASFSHDFTERKCSK